MIETGIDAGKYSRPCAYIEKTGNVKYRLVETPLGN